MVPAHSRRDGKQPFASSAKSSGQSPTHARRDDRAFPESEVFGYEPLIDAVTLPDPDDRHVLAAAIRCEAQLIVTENRRDFPAEQLSAFEVETMTADTFLVSTFELYPSKALDALRAMRRDYEAPPISPNELILQFQRNGLAQLAATLRPEIDAL